VYALNAKTSALLWSYYIGAGYPQFSSPAVANGVVYIGAADRRAFALNARTGALLWSHRSYGGNVSPAVADGVVYFPSDNGKVYALGLNAATSF
jgi:outer membrane protein assembly factor BamB